MLKCCLGSQVCCLEEWSVRSIDMSFGCLSIIAASDCALYVTPHTCIRNCMTLLRCMWLQIYLWEPFLCSQALSLLAQPVSTPVNESQTDNQQLLLLYANLCRYMG